MWIKHVAIPGDTAPLNEVKHLLADDWRCIAHSSRTDGVSAMQVVFAGKVDAIP